jgi:hypothetical protein
MARTWLSIRVDLVGGMHAPDLWPRPGRVLLARPGMTFRMLADAINDAFARWDRSHLHAFTLSDGTRVAIVTPWDDLDEGALDDKVTKLSRLKPGEQFAFEFDFGDSWMHLCTVADQKVDPYEVYGEAPDRPVAYFGWGDIPDQYGRRWDGDDGESPPPPPPEPLLGDLPDLHYTWGSRAHPSPVTGGPGRTAADEADIVVGPWGDGSEVAWIDAPTAEPWPYASVQDLRAAVRRRDLAAVRDLLSAGDALQVAHLIAPALIDAVDSGDRAAWPTVLELLPRLRERGWLGDDELVAEFERRERGEPGHLRPVPVDLDELASHLDGPTDVDEGSRLETATGQFWPRDPMGMAGVEEPGDFEDPDAFVTVLGLGSRLAYRDMEDFVGTVTDTRLAERLEVAIQGRGAFRRFKDTLFDDELWWGAWSTFSSERRLGRARWWLAEEGLRPSTGAR